MKKVQKRIKTTLGLINITLPLLLFGCSTDKSVDKKDEQQDEAINESSSESIENTNGTVDDKPKLAGTCPRGLHCSAPGQCGLFTDDNANDLCDRDE